MPYANDKDKYDLVFNFVNDAIGAEPDTISVLASFQLQAAWRPRILAESLDRADGPLLNKGRQFLEVFAGRSGELDRVFFQLRPLSFLLFCRIRFTSSRLSLGSCRRRSAIIRS